MLLEFSSDNLTYLLISINTNEITIEAIDSKETKFFVKLFRVFFLENIPSINNK